MRNERTKKGGERNNEKVKESVRGRGGIEGEREKKKRERERERGREREREKGGRKRER
jgi:hypothetical protein